jgi:hypothetical protein
MRLLNHFIFILIPALTVLIFTVIYLRPSGELASTFTVSQKSPYINRPLPAERISPNENGNLLMTAEPVYFTVNPPLGHYEQLELTFKFKTALTPIVEVGPQMNLFTQSFDLRPIYSSELNALPWPSKKFGNSTIWQKNSIPQTYDDLLNAERSEKTLIYHHEISEKFILQNYQSNPAAKKISIDARGSHILQTYIENEPLNIAFILTDMNRLIGKDEVIVKIIDGNQQVVAEKKLADDGNERNDQEVTRREVSFNIPNLPAGVYNIEIQTTSDIFIREIITTLTKLVFRNNLNLADPVGWRETSPKTVFMTDGSEFTLQTLHANTVQDIRLGEFVLPIREPLKKEQFIFGSREWRRLEVPLSNVQISTNGVIAFDPSFAFNPNPQRLSAWTDIENSDTRAVISSYVKPSQEGDWYTATIAFDPSIMPKIDGKSWRFVISAPGISDFGGSIEISSIKATFHRVPLRTLSDWINRLKLIF